MRRRRSTEDDGFRLYEPAGERRRRSAGSSTSCRGRSRARSGAVRWRRRPSRHRRASARSAARRSARSAAARPPPRRAPSHRRLLLAGPPAAPGRRRAAAGADRVGHLVHVKVGGRRHRRGFALAVRAVVDGQRVLALRQRQPQVHRAARRAAGSPPVVAKALRAQVELLRPERVLRPGGRRLVDRSLDAVGSAVDRQRVRGLAVAGCDDTTWATTGDLTDEPLLGAATATFIALVAGRPTGGFGIRRLPRLRFRLVRERFRRGRPRRARGEPQDHRRRLARLLDVRRVTGAGDHRDLRAGHRSVGLGRGLAGRPRSGPRCRRSPCRGTAAAADPGVERLGLREVVLAGGRVVVGRVGHRPEVLDDLIGVVEPARVS